MDSEFSALVHSKTWHLVPPTPGRNLIDCKWAFKIKHKADDTIDRYKARLVAKASSNTTTSIMMIHSVLW
jgi:hypothetical protein